MVNGGYSWLVLVVVSHSGNYSWLVVVSCGLWWLLMVSGGHSLLAEISHG